MQTHKQTQYDSIRQTVEQQHAFFAQGKTLLPEFRKAQLKKLRDALKSHEAEMIKAIDADFRKSEFETFVTELGVLYRDISEALKNMNKWMRRRRVSTNIFNWPAQSYVIAEPLGVSLIIGAWNYPYQLSLAPVIAAMTTGNTIILKPSELPVRTSQVMAKMVNEHFDPAYFAVLEGGVEETTFLLEQKFDKIFFTGSVPVGKIVYQAAARHLTPVTLELGGKSPAIVSANTNLKVTARRIVWAKFLNAGQTCIAPDYILVDRKVEDRLMELMKKEIQNARYAFENKNYVQIINDRNMDRLVAMLDESKIAFGGNYDRESRFIEPTLLQGVEFQDKVMQEEIFGPLLPVIAFDELSQAIALVRKLPKPLACYVFTKEKSVRKQILQQLSFGGGAVNDAIMHITNNRLPFGGVGDSGIGSYHGEAGFRAFTHYKSIMAKPFWGEPKLKYPPYTSGKLKWIKKFMG